MWGKGMDYNILWNNVLEIISKQLNPISFKTWFNDTFLIELDNQKATVKVSMNCQKIMLQKNYYEIIETTLNTLTNTIYEISFITEEEYNVKLKPDIEIIEPINTNKNINSNLNKRKKFR